MSNSCQQNPTNSCQSYNPTRNILLIPGESSNNGNASGPVTILLRHGVTMQPSSSPLLSSPNLSTSKHATLILCILILSTFSFAAAPDRITGPIDSNQTIALAKSLHPKAKPQYDLGPVEPSRQLSYITLLMAPSASQQKALDRLLAQQQDRKSPNYHKWLTPQQYADRFGLSQNDLGKVIT